MRALETTTAVADLKAADLDAVFFAGGPFAQRLARLRRARSAVLTPAPTFAPPGHGTCWDFDDAAVTKLVEEMYAADKVIGTVCHGPTALVKAKKPDGTPLVAGKTVTGFTDEEEKQVQKEKVSVQAGLVVGRRGRSPTAPRRVLTPSNRVLGRLSPTSWKAS